MIISDKDYQSISGKSHVLMQELQSVAEMIFAKMVRKYGRNFAEELMITCFENVMDMDIKKKSLFR